MSYFEAHCLIMKRYDMIVMEKFDDIYYLCFASVERVLYFVNYYRLRVICRDNCTYFESKEQISFLYMYISFVYKMYDEQRYL